MNKDGYRALHRQEHSVGRQVEASDDLTYTHDSLSGGLEYLRCGWWEIKMRRDD